MEMDNFFNIKVSKENMLYTALIAAVAGDIIPTPGDALAFHLQKELRDKWTKGEITSKQYWAKEALNYYTLNSAWWLLVFIITYNIKGTFEDKLKIALALVGGGMVIGVLIKNIKSDETEMLAEKNKEKEQLYQEKNGKV
jgi:hypothetical protein